MLFLLGCGESTLSCSYVINSLCTRVLCHGFSVFNVRP